MSTKKHFSFVYIAVFKCNRIYSVKLAVYVDIFMLKPSVDIAVAVIIVHFKAENQT